jgi:adenylosuccinate lyase
MSNAAPSPLTALSPLDGRYHGKVAGLREQTFRSTA